MSERDDMFRPPTWTKTPGQDPALLNELANLIRGDGFVTLSLRYGAAARILSAGWRPSSDRTPKPEAE